MSVSYRAVQWNRFKRRYDLVLAVFVVALIGLFVVIGKLAHRGDRAISDEVLLIRAFGTCAFVLLHVTLTIGPLARLDRRFLPLLYNRRHLGVTAFMLGLAHAVLAVGYYHGFGALNPLVSLLTSNVNYASISAFPFETLGLVALLILFLLAATSHDFWLKTLTPAVWKWLHMLVYLAWTLLVAHVALGALQSERSMLYVILLGIGAFIIAGLHILSAFRRRRAIAPSSGNGIDACNIDDLRDGHGKVIERPGAEPIAVFRHGQNFYAISNTCAHQGGSLGEGRIVDGCITCPWHGYQYLPETGCAPPPFGDKLPTFPVRIADGRVWIDCDHRVPEALREVNA